MGTSVNDNQLGSFNQLLNYTNNRILNDRLFAQSKKMNL